MISVRPIGTVKQDSLNSPRYRVRRTNSRVTIGGAPTCDVGFAEADGSIDRLTRQSGLQTFFSAGHDHECNEVECKRAVIRHYITYNPTLYTYFYWIFKFIKVWWENDPNSRFEICFVNVAWVLVVSQLLSSIELDFELIIRRPIFRSCGQTIRYNQLNNMPTVYSLDQPETSPQSTA